MPSPQDHSNNKSPQPSGGCEIAEMYPACRRELGHAGWQRIMARHGHALTLDTFPDIIRLETPSMDSAGFLPELARLEAAIWRLATDDSVWACEFSEITVNPSIHLLSFSWRNLAEQLVSNYRQNATPPPEAGENRVLIWRHPETDGVMAREASDADWLVLKLISEKIDLHKAAAEYGLAIGTLDAALDRAVSDGLLLSPPSTIRRDPQTHPEGERQGEEFETAAIFTLQWHITQACDLHCKHCYDRSNRRIMELNRAIGVLDELRQFCKIRHVAGQVSFTGGNPLLYPHFINLYEAASQRDFGIAILGNPTDETTLRGLIAIQKPVFFQVSLEGLPRHNDEIRGMGHFDRTVGFLDLLRQLDIYAMVMLTLTRDNMDQVLPLAEKLRPHADLFSFNRLSMVGEGADLKLPSRKNYATFLKRYIKAAETNPIIGMKDNLINILNYQGHADGFGGCTGFGCGAAFNFVSLLSDGEVHACRKFPSPIGHVDRQNLAEIYDSPEAERYRRGSQGCRPCPIRRVCGGCLAVTHSHGLDINTDVDPHCFM